MRKPDYSLKERAYNPPFKASLAAEQKVARQFFTTFCRYFLFMTSLAIVRQKYRPDGGAERFVASALSALSSQTQLDITVLTRKWQGLANPAFNIQLCNPFKFGRVSRERGFAKAVQKHFPEFDLVQSHERIPGCSIFRAGDGVHKRWLQHRSRIMTPLQARRVHNDRFHRYLMNAEKAMFEHPDLKAVICISEMVRQDILQEFDISPDKLHVIYNCVNLERFNPSLKPVFRTQIRHQYDISEDASLLLFVGSGFERKGLASAIKAIARTNSHLIIVGQDKKLNEYRQLAEKTKCAERVHFAGVQEYPEHFYAAADGFILPTLYEPFGNVILEAMASGIGVITTPTCGGADIVSEHKNGYIADALDLDSLTKAVKMFENSEHASTLGKNARTTAEAFTEERLSKELQELYVSCLK